MKHKWKVKKGGIMSEVAVVHTSHAHGLVSEGWDGRSKIIVHSYVDDLSVDEMDKEEKREAQLLHHAAVLKANIIALAFNQQNLLP